MSYGAQIINNDNIILIDDNYSNYCIYSTGSIGYGTGINIPNIAGALVFVNCTSGHVHIVSGGAPSTTMLLDGTFTSLSYIIAVPSAAMPNTTSYGLNIYKADGSLAFSSEYSYMSIVGMAAVNVLASYTQVTIAASMKTRYFCLNSCIMMGAIDALDTFYDPPIAIISDLYCNGQMIDNNTFEFGNSGYQEYLTLFNNGTYIGTLQGLTETRYILLVEF